MFHILKLSNLFEISDEITLKLERLKLFEFQDLWVNFDEIVVGEVKPLESIGFIKNILAERMLQTCQLSNLIIV